MKKLVWLILGGMAMWGGWGLYQANQYDFVTLDGQHYRWQDLHGQWVVLNYFAEWCAPCLREVPELNKFAEYARQTSEVSLFAMSYDSLSEDQLAELKDKYAMTFSLILPHNASMLTALPANLPVTLIISPEGEVIKHLYGEQTRQSLQAVLEHLQGL